MQLLFLLCELKVSPFFYFERSGVLLFQAYPAVKRASRWRLYIPRATPERSEKNHESMVSLEILKPHHQFYTNHYFMKKYSCCSLSDGHNVQIKFVFAVLKLLGCKQDAFLKKIRCKKTVKDENARMEVHAQIDMIRRKKKEGQITILIHNNGRLRCKNTPMNYLSTNYQYAWEKKQELFMFQY